MEEKLWSNLFEQPWMWRDNRATKSCPNFPDFKHSSTGAGLWIDSRSIPSWVPLKLSEKSSWPRNAVEGNAFPPRKSNAKKRNGADRETLAKFQRLQREGMRPSIGIILAALKVCTNSRDLEAGKKIHEYVSSSGDFSSTIFIPNTLVDMYAKCGSLDEARQVFESIHSRTVVSWSALILGYAQSGQGEMAWDLYSRMQREGCAPNRVTLLAALKACSSLAEKEEWKMIDGRLLKPVCLERGKAVHLRAAESGDDSSPFVENSLVDMYWKCGSMVDARRVFERMKHHDVVAWNAIILGYAQSGDGELAMEMYARMKDEGCAPDRVTLLATLKACACLAEKEQGKVVDGSVVKDQCLRQGRAIHDLAATLGDDSHTAVANTLVDMYAKCGSMADARSVFERIQERSVVSWNCLIAGYAQAGDGNIALELLTRMEEEGCSPDAVTFVAALKACSSLGALESGRELHARASIDGFETVPAVANALIDFYGKCGSMPDAEEVFEAACKKSLVTWSALLAGYSFQGNTSQVFQLFERMQKERIQPDHIAFLSVLTACRYAGLVDKAKEYFRSMREEFGIVPNLQHYTCLVDVLAQANHLEEAVSVVRGMPVKPDVIIWMVVLDACVKWENVGVGELAFQSVVKLESTSASAHVLMSNVYAATGLSKEASRIQNQLSNIPY
ncbi:pentatricopeptide repeat-containing protein At2g03380, mitochondrial-like isoform X2 [Selaginella moellendorffii]|uniref:pentatricopeptide repeat-containing protein At2g03380, mitochondrial-like isoform X2 n=1 Tax=Selaginella moellendorffii TaxID=88036 RepID=UPI000D1D114C|nr:pentatricopeptide repeat-containing protein At2g03380, mitochondrial-like isoform X2 [Selaginella moellendorffii]|eukprot:XP_024525225.1 pentatricopeptide repeat-containing protein At2g03380, mitochondrial-like isoform X2 [Selaginella moellendorffii]